MNISILDKEQARRGIRAAIAALAGGAAANNAGKARVAQSILGMSPGDAQSQGGIDDLRTRLTALRNACTAGQWTSVEAAISGGSESEEWEGAPVPSPAQPVPVPVPANLPADKAAALALLLGGGADSEKLNALEDKVSLVGRGLLAVQSAVQSLDAQALTDAAMQAVSTEVADIRAAMEAAAAQIAGLCQTAQASPVIRQRAAAFASRQNCPVLGRLNGLYTPGVLQAPLQALLVSAPGIGKSFLVRRMAAAYDVFVEHGCSNDSEEVNTLKGGATVRSDGSFVVYDGRITEAVRAAAAGKNTLLFLDEVLRLSDRAQNVLLTFLTGVKKPDGSFVYQWTTKQTDASGSTIEVLECPAERLHIIGAGNLNAAPVEAFVSRWKLVRVPYSEELVIGASEALLRENGVAFTELPRRFALAVSASRTLAAQGQIKWPLSTRAMEAAAVHAALLGITDERKVGELIADFAVDTCANWDARTGDVDIASVGALRGVQDVLNFTSSI